MKFKKKTAKFNRIECKVSSSHQRLDCAILMNEMTLFFTLKETIESSDYFSGELNMCVILIIDTVTNTAMVIHVVERYAFIARNDNLITLTLFEYCVLKSICHQ